MKRAILLSALMLFFAGQSRAQFVKGQSEISFLGSMGSNTSKQQNFGNGYSYSSSQTETYLSFGITYDYYVSNGFSLEPEVSMDVAERLSPAYFFLANISYTHMIPHSNVALFGLVGYGVTNGAESPVYDGALVRMTDKLNIGVFNAGVGSKFLASKSVVIRLELNYRSQSWKQSYYSGPGTDISMSNIGLFTGISFLF